MSVDPVEILHETDRILDERGWSENGAMGDNGEVCLGVALVRAEQAHGYQMGELGRAGGPCEAVEAEMAASSIDGCRFIPYFNDHIAESLEDIKRVTKGARVRLGGES